MWPFDADVVVDANVCVAVPYRRLITDSKVKLKYQHLITNSFVEVRWPDIHWNATRRLLMYGLAYVWRRVISCCCSSLLFIV